MAMEIERAKAKGETFFKLFDMYRWKGYGKELAFKFAEEAFNR